MSIMVETSPVLDALARLEAAEAEFAALSLDLSSDAEVLEVLRRREASKRRAAVVDHALIHQVDARHLDCVNGCKSVRQLLRVMLRISPGEASARVRAAKSIGPRQATSGEPLEPIYPTVAAAQAEGAISAQHAQVIVGMIEKLPVEVRAEWDRLCESTLVEIARDYDPDILAQQARKLAYRLDQDGQYKEATERHRNRHLTLRDNPDGSGHLEGDLTAECAERLRVMFDSLAKPRPAEDGTRDRRTPGQRRHDAFLEWLKLVEQAGTLPATGGVAATLLLIMDADVFATGSGTARTGHGFTVPADLAKTWAEPEARIMAILISKLRGIDAYSSTQRFFTEQQRLAMWGRDRGCTMVDCDCPLGWTDAHHVTDWQDTRTTSVDDGASVCGRDHDTFQKMGFTSVMINGRPHWIPPPWIDPRQKPRRNTMHD